MGDRKRGKYCLKNATSLDGKRSRLRWRMKPASFAIEAIFIFLGGLLTRLCSLKEKTAHPLNLGDS